MRWLVRLVGLLIVVAIVAVGSLLLLPGDRIAKIAADQISSMTGRDVTLSGDTTVSFYPVLGISTGALTVANADWSDGPPMLQAESLKIGVEPSALFGGDIRITGLEAVAPRINLERAADGSVNWSLGVEGVAPSGQSEGGTPAQSKRLALTLDRALISDATLVYTDHATGETTEIKGMNLDLQWPEFDGAATFDASFVPADEAVAISGRLDRVGHFIDGGVSDITANIHAPGGTLKFAGSASALPQASGALTGAIKDTSRLLTSLGLGAAEIPRGLGRAIDISTQLNLTEDMRLSLRETTLQLDGNSLTGAADVFLGGQKPRVSLQLNAGALDLTGLSADSGSGSGGSGDGSGGTVPISGWSKSPIPADALALADGEIALVAQSIDLGDFKLGKTRTFMTLDNSRMVFELRELQAYDGTITGQFVLNNRSGLSVGGQMKAGGINLKTFLNDAVGISRFAASANGHVNFLGVGQSLHAIMNSLKGDGAINTGRGVISGIDLDKLMRSGDLTGGTTVFDSMTASFTINKGNLFNQDLLMKLPLATSRGNGRIGLGARDIDYLFTPTLLEGESRKGLAIPVRIRGPWANPRITPDLEKAIDMNLKEEQKKLEAKAEKEINRALEKELGVTREEGQSTEDALKKKLEEKAKKELFKLFD